MVPPYEKLITFKNNKDISDFYKVSEKTVRRWLLKYNLTEIKKNFGKKLDAKTATEIRNKHKEKIPIKNIAEKYGVTKATIYRIINNQSYRTSTNVYCSGSASVSVIYNNTSTVKLDKPKPSAIVEVIKASSIPKKPD